MTKLIIILWFCLFAQVQGIQFVPEKFYVPKWQVPTRTGLVQGVELFPVASGGDPIFAYKGIPYAEPPIGKLRFKPPKPLTKKWKGILNATVDGPACARLNVGLSLVLDGQEDCLSLNIFTPQSPQTKMLLPVMVFFFGGAFIDGHTNTSIYNPEHFVKENVIVMTVNYRLGVFGFLSTGDMASPGNYGLHDQSMALRRVQRNIKRFGGNPKKVTIFGQSAGSVATHYHVMSPKSKGLFHGAILESGTVLCPWSLQTHPKHVAFLVATFLGIRANTNQELVDKLREMDFEDLELGPPIAFLQEVATASQFGLPFAPTVEPEHPDAFISKPNVELLETGNYNQVPIMMGTNPNETLFLDTLFHVVKPVISLFYTNPILFTPKSIRNFLPPDVAKEVGKRIKEFYAGNTTFAELPDEAIYSFLNDDNLFRAEIKSAMLMAQHKPVYFYVFDYSGYLPREVLPLGGGHPFTNGIAHSEELVYMWQFYNFSASNNDEVIRQRLIKLWTNFAKYGNPTPEREEILENIRWPVLNENGTKFLYLNINKNLTIKENFRDKEMSFWENIFKKYGRPDMYTY